MEQIDEYAKCIEEFLLTCRQLDAEIISILLYGSVARGDIRVGHSDVLDATIVFQDRVLDNQTTFYRALDLMVLACHQLSATGLPFHPFHYFTLEEACHSYWSLYLRPWGSNSSSLVLHGSDIRPLFRSIEENDWFNRGAIFAECYRIENAARFLVTDLTHLINRTGALQVVKQFLKTMPHLACVACDLDVDPAKAISALKVIVPDLDLARLYKLHELKNVEAKDVSPDDVRIALNNMLQMNQELVDGVIAWLLENNQWATFIDTVVGTQNRYGMMTGKIPK
jgi:hypothetical protein